MPVDQNITQQLAALVALVSVSIIGVAILLISKIWNGFENTSVGLTIPERRLINRILLLGFGPLLLFLFITDFIGVYAPVLFQPVARSLFLLFLVIWIISILVFRIIRWKKKAQPSPRIEPLPLLYRTTLIWIALCIFTCLIALFGVAYPMLNIEIGPFNQENFNWARWFLVDGILFFIMGVLTFAFMHIFQRVEKKREADDIVKKKPIFKWVGWVILAIFSCLLVANIVTMVKQFDDKGSSFINTFLSMPLDVKGSVSISGTQFKITNESEFDWENVTISLNKEGLSSGYALIHELLRKGETYTVDITEFAKSDGTRFNLSTMKPLRFSVEVHNSVGQVGMYSGGLKEVSQ